MVRKSLESSAVGLFRLVAALALVLSTAAYATAQTLFVDDAGRSVEIPERIERVMAAGPPASVLLYALAPDRMVGWVRAPTDEDKNYIAKVYHDLPEHGRLTGRGGTANIEAVLALQPDLIIDVGTIDETHASLADRVQEQTGIPYLLISGRFAESSATILKAGELLGERETAEKLAKYADDAMIRLGNMVETVPEAERPRVYYGRGPDGLETGLAGSINMEVLDAVGAINVAASAGTGGLANVSIEQVLSWNPDVVLTLDRTFHQSLGNNPLWAGVKAIAEGRVYRAPTVPFGWFDTPPGVNRLMSAAWLASLLYPDRAGIDLRSETREFYRLFYHVDPSDEEIDALLSDTQNGP